MTTIELDPVLAAELAELVPCDEAAQGDWLDVERRARSSSSRQRPLLLAATIAAGLAALLVTPLGGAVAGGIEDFSSWLGGSAGRPASEEEQGAFDDQNARSWSAFPPGTKLRRLLVERVGGIEYTVLGLRAGDDICVRVRTSGDRTPSSFGCVPVSALRSATAPVIVVRADQPVYSSDDPAASLSASVTFGIAADGVTAVDLGDGSVDVVDNAFLYVASDPKPGARVHAAAAVLADGRRVDVPFAAAPYGTWDLPAAPDGKPLGPSRTERSVSVGTVGWIEKREPRGTTPPPAMVELASRGMPGRNVFARLIELGPDSGFQVLVREIEVDPADRRNYGLGGRMVCFTLVARGALVGGGCNRPSNIIFDGPFTVGESLPEGSDQYEIVNGVANDDVARMTLFQANGEVVAVSLQDNMYAVRALRAAFPVRLVAYDAGGRVIGIKTLAADIVGRLNRLRPATGGAWRTLISVSDAHGRVRKLVVAPASGGGTCYELRGPGGEPQTGCRPRPYNGAALAVAITGIETGAPILTGIVADPVERVVVRYPGGGEATLQPVEGYVLAPLDAARVKESGSLVVEALDEHRHTVARSELNLRR
jgi:hypothetical protein